MLSEQKHHESVRHCKSVDEVVEASFFKRTRLTMHLVPRASGRA